MRLSFHVAREVTGLNEQYLKDQIEGLIRNINYRGHITITFPLENPSVSVYSDHRVNRLRTHWGMIFLSIITLTIIFIWPVLFFLTKRYEVVKAEWPFSKQEESGRTVYATVSEEQWFKRWAKIIEKAALGRREVALTQEDLARGIESEWDATPSGSSGNQFLDGARDMLHAGVRVYNEVNRQVGWGYDC
jgi:hypothetical protein